MRNSDMGSAVADAVAALARGELVAFPTETVYGLGADATDDHAVAALYAAKGRPSFNPLISHLPDVAAVDAIAVLDGAARVLAENLWPGPLTLVLDRRENCPVSLLATAGLDTLAVRVPAHPVAQELLRAFGRPVVAPSANVSGRVSATEADHVRADFADRVAVVLDGGATPIGIESTIVGFPGGVPTLLRAGGVPRAEIEALLGRPLAEARPAGDAPSSPGQLQSHYAPAAAVRLDAKTVAPGEALLAFGPHVPAHDGACLNLSESGDTVEAAANLFAFLRRLDRPGIDAIAVMPVPREGLGEAINDRLARAAAPRNP